jgi:large repetitive protein
VALNPDGSFTYTPDGLSLSPDTFTYEVTDGEFTSTATVTINTTP